MKLTRILALWLAAVPTVACAQATSSAPTKTTPSAPADHVVYVIGKCNFRINDLHGGTFSADKESGGYTGLEAKNNPAFTAYCHAGTSQNDLDEQLDIKQANGKLVWSGNGMPFSPPQHFQLRKFAGKNWSGTSVGYDMTEGPEERRQRLFLYCLIETKGSQVLCGNAEAGQPSSPATSKTIQKILAVLKSVEFVDPSTAAANPASAATVH